MCLTLAVALTTHHNTLFYFLPLHPLKTKFKHVLSLVKVVMDLVLLWGAQQGPYSNDPWPAPPHRALVWNLWYYGGMGATQFSLVKILNGNWD